MIRIVEIGSGTETIECIYKSGLTDYFFICELFNEADRLIRQETTLFCSNLHVMYLPYILCAENIMKITKMFQLLQNIVSSKYFISEGHEACWPLKINIWYQSSCMYSMMSSCIKSKEHLYGCRQVLQYSKKHIWGSTEQILVMIINRDPCFSSVIKEINMQ